MLTFRFAEPSDADLIAPLLRRNDALEVIRAGHGHIIPAMRRSVEESKKGGMAGLFLDDGQPVALFGVAPKLGIGIPWLVGTDAINLHQKTFLKETRFWVRQWQRNYPLLMNHVDASYSGAIRWLSWLGFSIGTPQPIGLAGAMFCRFEMQGGL
ncbi:hypothetical protein [Bombella sp. ESL0385]|uniref:hypothetical protein n=1 Tax=Bombella sp. ESL0385 TaxID=2676446 RepID=UPI0012D8BB51|nr:hypothetical protein [Bombella sp. ESL0385]MUG90143.1 hypothetical protein [Bombella sp. ESL0385]